jgi:hypothetical protein
VLVGHHGREGVVLGMALGFLPFLLFGNVAEIVRVFRTLPGDAAPPAPELLETADAMEGRP